MAVLIIVVVIIAMMRKTGGFNFHREEGMCVCMCVCVCVCVCVTFLLLSSVASCQHHCSTGSGKKPMAGVLFSHFGLLRSCHSSASGGDLHSPSASRKACQVLQSVPGAERALR